MYLSLINQLYWRKERKSNQKVLSPFSLANSDEGCKISFCFLIGSLPSRLFPQQMMMFLLFRLVIEVNKRGRSWANHL